MIKIFIGGDFAPRLRVNPIIESGDYSPLFNEMIPIIRDCDLKVLNLESPLIDKGTPICKTGANIKSPTCSVNALSFLNIDMVTLANNHIMDYGEEGLLSTIKHLKTKKIDYIGAGSNLGQASSDRCFERSGKKITFINACENEWSTTDGQSAGANPIDEIGMYRSILKAKISSDYVIVIIHGGHELYSLPSPRMKKLYRWFVDLGADAVIAHHTHCFSGFEMYNNVPIVYSLGNFLFDIERPLLGWNVGAAAVLSLPDDNQSRGGVKLELFPFSQCDNYVGIKLFNEEERKKWIKKENNKSLSIIQDDTILTEKFVDFTKSKKQQYYDFIEPIKNRLISGLIRRRLFPRLAGVKFRNLLYNIIHCESHREILIKILDTKNNK